MLWAATAYAAGLFISLHLGRPPTLWIAAVVIFIAAGLYWIRRRPHALLACALAAIFSLGALAFDLRSTNHPPDANLFNPDAAAEVTITAHVTAEPASQNEASDELRQRLDVETETIAAEGAPSEKISPGSAGIRLSIYGKNLPHAGPPQPALLRYGDRLRFPAHLVPPRNFRNPGAFDYEGYLKEQGILALASVKADRVEHLPGFSGSRIELWRTRIHRHVIDRVHALWPPAEAGLMDAMVIGNDAFLRRGTRVDFQRSGTYHVLVVSGMNVSILAMVAFWTLTSLRLGDLLAGLITVSLTFAYAFLTDVGPPVWRATLMLALYLGARLFYREKSMLNAIGAAALGVMIFDPIALFGASFQLTFLCVLLIAAIGAPLLERTLQPYSRSLRQLNAVTYDAHLRPRIAQFRLDLRLIAASLQPFVHRSAAQILLRSSAWFLLATAEILVISAILQAGLALPMAYYFHRVTVVAMPANLLVIPLLQLLMPAAIAGLALSYLWMPLARLPALLAGLALQGITGTVRGLGGAHIADVRVATPTVTTILLSLAALLLAALLVRRRALLASLSLASVVASALWLCYIPRHVQTHPGVLELTAIDVGQGDSLLLITPQGRTLLIDAGGLPYWMHSEFDTGEDVVSPYLWSRGIQHLDAVAITHPHSDHIGGMPAILANFHPSVLWLGVEAPNEAPSQELQHLLSDAKARGVSAVQHQAGDQLQFGGATFRILSPFAAASAPQSNPQSNKESRNESHRRNDESLTMKVSYGNTSALLEGDAEWQTESRIATEQPAADVLKVAHHGSATSTHADLLAAVHPKFAVISVGPRNVYGHPRGEVLARLQSAKVLTYRTDLEGAITFYLDGTRVSSTAFTLH